MKTQIRQIAHQSLKYNIQNRTKNFSNQTKNNIKNIMNKQTIFQGIRYLQDPTNKEQLITDPSAIKSEIRSFYSLLFDEHKNNPPINELTQEQTHWFTPIAHIDASQMTSLIDPITINELDQTIRSLGNLRAPGPDGITYEYFKFMDPDSFARQFILNLLNYFFKFNYLPKEIGRSLIILLQKTYGIWTGDPTKLRPITLLQTTRKLFTGILNKRLQYLIEKYSLLRGFNFGFKPGHNTNNNATILRLLIDHARLHNRTLFIALLDIQKAYDTVPFELVRYSLLRLHVPLKFIEILYTLHNCRTIRIDTPFGLSDIITPNIGLPQGDKISCIIWNIAYDPLLCELHDLHGYVSVHQMPEPTIPDEEINITHSAFADDLNLIAETLAQLQPQLDLTNTISSFLTCLPTT
jgi:hypothetical protein